MSSISLPLSTKDKDVYNAIVYKGEYRRKLWVFIKGYTGCESGRYEFIEYAGCFMKKCFIGRTCSFPYYYIREE